MKIEKRIESNKYSHYTVAISTTKNEMKALQIKYSLIDENDISIDSLLEAATPFHNYKINALLIAKLAPEIIDYFNDMVNGDISSPIPSNLKVLALLKEIKGGEIRAAKWRRRHNVERYTIDGYTDYYVRTKR